MGSSTFILFNANVVTMDDEFRIFKDGAVAVSDETILSVGPQDEIRNAHPEAETIDCQGKILIPGLINAHTHVPMALLRGLTDDRRLDVWLLGYVMPVEREFVTPEFCRLGTTIACAELIRGGVTCFADMYYYEDTVAAATAEAGMRAICGQTVVKFPSPDAASYEEALDSAESFIQQWKDHPLIVPAIAPHAPYTCTPEILQACTKLAIKNDVPLLIHISETLDEAEEWRQEYEMPVVPWVKKLGLLEAKVLAAHCVYVDGGEIRTLEHSGVGVAHNPSSNLKLASGFAPVVEMLEAGLNVGVGTDGPTSNNDLDMFEEMRLATFLAKGVSNDPTVLPAREILAMATVMGARALHLGEITGSIEPGKRADLALVEDNVLHNQPHFNREPEAVYSRLVYAAKSTDVSDVMVNGKWLMRDRELLTIDLPPLIEAAQRFAHQIDAFLIEREGSVLSKLVGIGGAEQEESYEVQIKVRLEDPSAVLEKLASGDLDIVRQAHYMEYDTYFEFQDDAEGRLRYREDEFVGPDEEVFNARYRLTLTGPVAERTYPNSILLSRSRFIAPAVHSLRFYREYFQPDSEVEITKDRLRWLVKYGGIELFINLDRILKPKLEGAFLEIKSRTWSIRDAENKVQLISMLLQELGAQLAEVVPLEYPDLVSQ